MLAACEPSPDAAPSASPDTVAVTLSSLDPESVPYDLSAPDVIFELPPELTEISGLTVLSSGHVGAVQDEDGVLFEIDAQTGRVLSKEGFGDDGDYEGIEATPDALWVLESNGDLYRIQRAGRALETEVFETDLSGRNDAEGLGYDAAGDRLLVALKEHPGKGLGRVRSVFAFDLATNTLSDAPAFTLDRAIIDTGSSPFKTSAIAVRPGTDEAYLLSSVAKALLVVGLDGTIRAAVSLPVGLYRQPEGIAFAPDGTLFISNEGAGASATLLRFSPR